ncbi:MAG: DNA polymerase III subunit delta [Bacteroidales bacterium]|jgi:DNA polymerase III subunit delta|nr:DNA polymerase III subunit delta [Bacteroidales bacterium]MDD3160929.1 DNA polymerase III subunit delta [Bacteroidales bacterium]
MAKKNISFESIMDSIQKREYVPVYGLMGEEPYFIDRISDSLEKNVLSETEKDFNLTVLYGADSSVSLLLDEVRRYPLMADYHLVIVKEAQNLDHLDELIKYLQNPLSTTILVINYKYGKIDRKLATEIDRKGILFESLKMYDNQLPEWIFRTLQQKKIKIDSAGANLLSEYTGNDLSKLDHEIEKLLIILQSSGGDTITSDLIEKCVGISKEYNNFELVRAVLYRDVLKANRIVNYFEKNPKKNPLLISTATLFNTFSTLVIAYSQKDRSQKALSDYLGLKNYYQWKDIEAGMSNFSPIQVVRAISYLREYDGKSKGAYGNSTEDGELLRELIYKLLH